MTQQPGLGQAEARSFSQSAKWVQGPKHLDHLLLLPQEHQQGAEDGPSARPLTPTWATPMEAWAAGFCQTQTQLCGHMGVNQLRDDL